MQKNAKKFAYVKIKHYLCTGFHKTLKNCKNFKYKKNKIMVTYVIYFSFCGRGASKLNVQKLEYSNSSDAFSMASKISQSELTKLISLDVVKNL